MPDPASEIIARNVAAVRRRIAESCARAGRDPGCVRLVAVTKSVSAPLVRLLLATEVTDLGENRIQEAEDKIPSIGPGPRWHLIGHLQRNKARRAVALFSLIHSVDSARLLLALSRIADETPGTVIKALVQVNVSGEDQKQGVPPEGVRDLLAEASRVRNVEVCGLMGMAPYAEDPESARPSFRRLARIREDSDRGGWYRVPLVELSMGMSGDFEVAVEEGATLVRVGSALFAGVPPGERIQASEGK